MKRFAPICLLVLSACSGVVRREAPDANGEILSLVFHFQTGFDRTPVSFYVEDRLIFEEVLTTDNRVGVARKVPWPGSSTGKIRAEVVLDQAARTSWSIDPEEGQYVGFSKDLDTGKLTIDQRREPFAYD